MKQISRNFKRSIVKRTNQRAWKNKNKMNNTMDKTEEQLIRQEILSEGSPNFQRDLKCERKLGVIVVAFCW